MILRFNHDATRSLSHIRFVHVNKAYFFEKKEAPPMYLSLQSLSQLGPSIAELLFAALSSPQDVTTLLPDIARDDARFVQLQRLSNAGPIFLDLWEADTHLSEEECVKIVQAIKLYWHRHGFCIARCTERKRWIQAASRYQQPLLLWRSLSVLTGWELLGYQLHVPEFDVYRLLVSKGHVTVNEIAMNPTIFSQHLHFSNPHVLHDIAIGRQPQDPSVFNQSEAQRVLARMQQMRLLTFQHGVYSIVHPTQIRRR